jgi:hypothetical protein
MGAGGLAVKRKAWAVLRLARPAMLLLRIRPALSAFVPLRPSRLRRSEGRELSWTFLILGRVPWRTGQRLHHLAMRCFQLIILAAVTAPLHQHNHDRPYLNSIIFLPSFLGRSSSSSPTQKQFVLI